MKKIVAVNASPRTAWNTATLVREAARGAETAGAEVQVFDLYKSDAFTGCISCFGCKLPEHLGTCVCKDGLTPVLDAIRSADGLILGSPNYLGNTTAAFRALYERLVFQSLSYKLDPRSYNRHPIPVLFIMTSNAPESSYENNGYIDLLARYQNTLSNMIGPTNIMVSSDTLQVHNYEKYQWTMFNPEAKKQRHDTVFQEEKKKANSLGEELVNGPWVRTDGFR